MTGVGFEKLSALILTGGRGSRLGGVEKARIIHREERLIDTTVRAARESGAREIVVVGDRVHDLEGDSDSKLSQVRFVRESPPFSGPLAALEAGISEVQHEWILLLAGDLPFAREGCRILLAAAANVVQSEGAARPNGVHAEPAKPDGFCLVDDEGIHQFLFGVYRAAAIRKRLSALAGETSGKPLRIAFRGLDVRGVPTAGTVTRDIDTPEDLGALGANLPE